MENNLEVECWCCKYYLIGKTNFSGTCELLNTTVSVCNKVCEQFLLNSGLHTKRTIPEYCVNYTNKKDS